MRESIDLFVTYMLAPIFFGSVCISADFIKDFDYPCVLLLFFGSCVGKFVGAAMGAKLAMLPWRDSLAVATCLNARGAMELILASVAMQQKIINGKMFVALVFMAIVTSLMPGPMLRKLYGKAKSASLAGVLHKGAFARFSDDSLQGTLSSAVSELAKLLGHENMADVMDDLCVVVRHEAPYHHATGSAVVSVRLPTVNKISCAVGILPAPIMVAGMPTTNIVLLVAGQDDKDTVAVEEECKMLFTSEDFSLELMEVGKLIELLALIQIEHFRRVGRVNPGARSSPVMSMQQAQEGTAEDTSVIIPAAYDARMTFNGNMFKANLVEKNMLTQPVSDELEDEDAICKAETAVQYECLGEAATVNTKIPDERAEREAGLTC